MTNTPRDPDDGATRLEALLAEMEREAQSHIWMSQTEKLALIRVAIAAERRRQAEDALIAVKDRHSFDAEGHAELMAAHTAVTDMHVAVRDALERLAELLTGSEAPHG